VELDRGIEQPRSVLRSLADGSLWVVFGPEGELALGRIDLDHGRVETFALEALARADQAWLVQGEDGTLALLVSHAADHALWSLDARDELVPTLLARGEGAIAHAPVVDHGVVLTSITTTTERGSRIEPVHHALSAAIEE
jgi:streptogramin lyase